MKKVKLLALLFCAFMFNVAIGQITYSGPYSTDSNAPTALTLGIGTNTISYTYTTPPSATHYFDVTLPVNMEITNVTLAVSDPSAVSSGTMCWNPFSTCNPSDTWGSGGQGATVITAWSTPGTLPITSSPGVIQMISSVAANTTWSLVFTVSSTLPCTAPTVPTVSYTPSTICAGNTATLNISGTLNDATQWNVYSGSCGGTLVGSTTGSTLVVTPAAPSTTYYVRGEGGCVTPGSCGSTTVTLSNPIAQMSGGFGYFGCGPLTVNFTDASTAGGSTITNWLWNFGDGNTSTQQNPTHIYQDPGVYNVSLQITTANGCTNTISKPAFVQVIGPDIDFSTYAPLITTGCAPLTIDFRDLTIFGAPIISWSWNFGDGNTSALQEPVHTYTTNGLYDVSLTISDIDGCTRTLTKLGFIDTRDTTNPTATCQNITIQLDATGNASIVAADIDDGSTDNCGTVNLSASQTAFTCANLGANNVTLTVNDGNGNSDTCVAVVTVEDNVVPTVICQNITIQLDAAGNASIVAADIDDGSTDNCGTVNLSASQTAFTCANLGANNVTLTVNDGNGNSDTCVAVVTVEDNVAPTVICQNITIQLDATGNATITAADIDNGSSDNCGTVNLSASQTAFTCANLGANNVTLTVNDGNGNSDTCVAIVTVEDNVAPVVDIANLSDITTECEVTSLTNPTATDNCAGTVTATHNATLPINTQGTTVITWTYTDGNGNTTTQVQNVIITDITLPVALTQNITVTLDDNGNASIVPPDIDNGSSDNCAIVDMSLDLDTFDCFNLGDYTVNLTVTDVGGNTHTTSAVVTIIGDDLDGDTIEDACDDDVDGDGVLNVDDNCEFTPNPDQTDLDQDNIGDACDDFIDIKLTVNDTVTPNGDTTNDTWFIENIFRYPNATIKVFNRWGVKVFETKNGYNNDWAGNSTEGGSGTLPVNSYYYVIELNQPSFGTYGITPITGWFYLNY